MTTVKVPVPAGVPVGPFKEYVAGLASHQAVQRRVAAVLEQEKSEVGPATLAQLGQVEHLRRHLIQTYGVYTSAEIAALRGAKSTNRSVATNLAKIAGLIGFTRGRMKVYPRFEFSGREPHPDWSRVSRPLLAADWDDEDVLLWMVSPHPLLDGREPAELIEDDPDRLQRLVEQEALGHW